VIRYWTFWIVTISLLSILFIRGLFAIMDSLNAGQGVNLWAAIGLGVLLYVLMAVLQAKRSTSPLRFPLFTTMDVGFKYQELTFSSRDGLELSGWFIPGKNGVTVVVTHGFSGNRLSGVNVARMLHQQGFAVLLYDLRGHGRSQPEISTWGWAEINDLLGAVDYLRSRPDVDAERIGALGYSLGAQISIRAAAQERWIKAVAAEGTTFAALSDHIVAPGFSLRKLVFYPWLWLSYTYQTLLTGVRQPKGVVEEAPKIAPRPVLLIAAGRGEEYLIARRLLDVAGKPKELYHVPEAAHTECGRARPEEYAKKLGEFFAKL
jgi:pimeloyl-ACP methyl ester carboxylesterase